MADAGRVGSRGANRIQLFLEPYGSTTPVRSLDVAPAGDRFVLIRSVESEPRPVTDINLVLNWFEELERLVPAP